MKESPRSLAVCTLLFLLIAGACIVPARATAQKASGAAACAGTPIQVAHAPASSLQGIPWLAASPRSSGISGYFFFMRPGARAADATLHTGGKMPNGDSTKVLWIVGHEGAGSSLTIDGQNLTRPGRSHQSFPVAGSSVPGSNYPSIIVVPTAGCWRFQLHSGTVQGTIVLPVVATADVPSLGTAPADCGTNLPPVRINPAFGLAVGMSPAWAIGFSPGLALHLGDPRFVAHGPRGWYVKILWVIAPGFRQRVGLSGALLPEMSPLWFQIGNQAPSTAPMLEPGQAPIPSTPSSWSDFPSYLFIPRAGCYLLHAAWPGGSWELRFAAGR